jgi:hypothetical protein
LAIRAVLSLVLGGWFLRHRVDAADVNQPTRLHGAG